MFESFGLLLIGFLLGLGVGMVIGYFIVVSAKNHDDDEYDFISTDEDIVGDEDE